MHHLIKDGQHVAQDPWILVNPDDSIPDEGAVILPLAYYREQRDEWKASQRPVGVWLSETDFAEDVSDLLDDLSLIALSFPKFADGRGFSKARLIRERYRFDGEIRAIGEFLPDQAHYLKRCGVNAFACRNADEAETTRKLLDTFSVQYQSAVGQSALFEQR